MTEPRRRTLPGATAAPVAAPMAALMAAPVAAPMAAPVSALVAAPLAALVAALVAGCGTPAPARPPSLELPTATAAAPTGLDRWWTRFGDPRLDALVDEALAGNLDLQQAAARIDEARAAVRLARSSLVPQVDARLQSSRGRRSESVATPFPGDLVTSNHRLELQTAFELDLWGRLRDARQGAELDLLATRAAADTVRIALVAEVVRAWFALHALDAELALTHETLATREQAVALLRERAAAGLAGDYELRLAEAERAAVAAGLPAVERARAATESALAALAGRSPRAVFEAEVLRGLPLVPDIDGPAPEVPAGLPADLLARRPDLREAEARWAAADARVMQARAQLYPRLTLSGAFGGESAQLGDVLTAPARIWSLAGALVQPLLGREQIGADIDRSGAQRVQAQLAWQARVQGALREVRDALSAHRAARDTYLAQDQRRATVLAVLQLADLRWRAGESSYLEVLDAQRNLLEADRGRLNALRDRRLALVDVYKALGGGWSPPGAP